MVKELIKEDLKARRVLQKDIQSLWDISGKYLKNTGDYDLEDQDRFLDTKFFKYSLNKSRGFEAVYGKPPAQFPRKINGGEKRALLFW